MIPAPFADHPAEWRSERSRRSWESRRRTLDAAFWEKVDQSAGPDGCWPWLASRQTPTGSRLGYGFFRRHGKVVYAHRRALELSLGRTLLGHEHALHSCDNPPCVNPAHLRVGDQASNMADAAARGRTSRGGSVVFARLTEEQAREVKVRLLEGERASSIAASVGLTYSGVCHIRRGTTWAWLEPILPTQKPCADEILRAGVQPNGRHAA